MWLCHNEMHLMVDTWHFSNYWRPSFKYTHKPHLCHNRLSNSYLLDSHYGKIQLVMEWIQVMTWKRKVWLSLINVLAITFRLAAGSAFSARLALY